MPKKMLIDATHAEETRVVVVEGNKVEEFDFESINKRPLAGNIYLAKVTRVEPSLQAAFVDYGGNRHGFLAFSEVHPDYYQIPVEDRQKLLEEEAAFDREQQEEEEKAEEKPKPRGRGRKKTAKATSEGSGSSADDVISEPAGEDDAPLLVETPEDGGAAKESEAAEVQSPAEAIDEAVAEAEAEAPSEEAASETETSEPVKKPRGRGRGRRKKVEEPAEADDQPEVAAEEKDADIESVAAEDVHEEIRPRRKRMRRYNIQEVIKVRQILLVQVVKEERGNKGAALTTYLSLAGRYCVLMPNTARGGGISRKITNPADRKKLKAIAQEMEVPQGAGLIVRTAGAKRTKVEVKRDYEYLLRQWEQIRENTMASIAPKLIYEEGNLIKRSIRDLYNREIDEILVEGENGYKEAREYMQMLLPSHVKNVKLYSDPLTLLARYQVENYLNGIFNPTVQLKSGGYIVIGITEALVAVDVNSGRATKEGSIEETALKTNLEAAEEVARQMRLRDLAGLLVIDFIDMEERRNNIAVEKRLKDSLKTDRARIQVGRISGFGLLEMSRQRLRPGMLEMTTSQCPHCHGTGYTRSNDNLALAILRELEEEGVRGRSKEVLVTVPISIANYMLNQKREHVATIEGRYGLSVRIEADMHLISPEYNIERLKTATRIVAPIAASTTAVTIDSIDHDEAQVVTADALDQAERAQSRSDAPNAPQNDASDEEGGGKKRRRRRRRRGGRGRNGDDNANPEAQGEAAQAAEGQEAPASDAAPVEAATDATPDAEEKPKRKRAPRTRKPKADIVEAEADAGEVKVEAAEAAPEAEEKPKRKRAPRKKKVEAEEAPAAEVAAEAEAPAEKPKRKSRAKPKPKVEAAQEIEAPVAEAPVAEAPAPKPKATPKAAPEPALETAAAEPADDPDKPKRRGWWSRATGR